MSKDKSLILIVDDNPNNIQFLGGLFTETGFEIGVAQNGIETLAFVRDKPPDLILLDIMMPEMDGFETCQRLKSDKRYRHIPVIFITAKTETKDIVKGFHLGGVDYVTKPFISEELLARVRTHIQMKTLKSLLPICSNCRKIRDEEGLWSQMEAYIEKHTDTDFSHGICEECSEKLYGDSSWYKKIRKEETQ